MDKNFELVKQKLKEEFFGIDEQIDQVVKSFETWLVVKEYQTRPMTVCLWGLTGTGKTALVNRAIELLDIAKKKFYIKFGSKTSRIDDDFELNTCEDTIFILDEFQYFKTKKENGNEIDRDEDNSTNIIWELLDGGIVNLYGQNMGYNYERLQLTSTIHILKTLNSLNVKLSNGVMYHPELFKHLRKFHIPLDKIKDIEDEKASVETMDSSNIQYYGDDDDDNEKTETINLSHVEIRLRSAMQISWPILYDFVKNRDTDYTFLNKNSFYDFLRNINSISELINFIQIIKDSKPKLEIRNYSKSLIFVLGNLDECFTMSDDLNSDLDADYFYKKTKNTTIVDIRRALLKRFRAEQIARLGSTHIIYPSLNKKAFELIINKELTLFEKMAQQKFSNENSVTIKSVNFHDSIRSLIYKEGVFPIIGARSVFSIVNEIVSDKFPTIIKTMLSFDVNNIKQVNVTFKYLKNKNLIEICFYNVGGNILLLTETFKYETKIDRLRVESNKGKQTHRAVHEAGHAVCSVILEHSFPEVIYSVVLDDKTGGFNLLNQDDLYYHRKNNYMHRVSTMLGGYAAEKIVFGDENISNGSGSDIEKSTSLINTLLKDTGFMDGMIGKYVSKTFVSTDMESTNYTIVDTENVIDEQVKALLNKGLLEAINTLHNQEILFLKVSEYLAKNPKMTNKKLKELTKKYISGIKYEDLLKDKQLFYVEMLNDKIKSINNGE